MKDPRNSPYWPYGNREQMARAYWIHRGSACWNFCSIWCSLLVQAPPTTELLTTLWQLTENTFYAPLEEIDDKEIVKWLKVGMRTFRTRND
jgi:hypothetical protein